MSSGFVTETDLEEARKKRQEEWEKVRKPEDPLERPEEPYDGRSLFDRLQEQKVKKDLEFEEAHKLKNLIRGLEDDEVQFLEQVDKTKLNAEKKQMLEDEKELREFREKVASLNEQSIDQALKNEIKTAKPSRPATTTSSRPTQKALLGAGIKRKTYDDKNDSKKPKLSNTNDNNIEGEVVGTTSSNGCANKENNSIEQQQPEEMPIKNLLTIETNELNRGKYKCIGILPGLGHYTESSDSELSSGSDEEPENSDVTRYDLLGRKRQKKKCQA